MPISIYGDTSGDNYRAALTLRPVLEAMLGAENEAAIVVAAFTPGCEVQDTDLVVLARCRTPVDVPPAMLPANLRARPAKLTNFALAIEVKSHGPEGIRFDGNQVLVRYRDKVSGAYTWHAATTQNLKQINSLKTYMGRERLRSPWWVHCVWLLGCPVDSIPKVHSNLLGATVTPEDILQVVVTQRLQSLEWQMANKAWKVFYVSCSVDKVEAELKDAALLFTRRIQASPMDRRKIEKITKRTVEPELPEYVRKMGTQCLMFRGRGGTGKTVRLLQIAHRLCEDMGARVLFLTYNRALAADLNRLMHLMGRRQDLDEATVSIQTSERFFWRLMKAFGEAPDLLPGAPFPAEAFAQKKIVLRELFAMGTPEVLRELGARADPSLVTWDFVLVDEAQDWPSEERDILGSLFGPNRLIIADGVDQLIRSDGRCDWTQLTTPDTRQIVSLRKALRLKSNICAFVDQFVDVAGLEWDIAVNDEVLGGRVVIVHGPYTREVHFNIMETHVESGNKPVDALFCVSGASDSAGGSIGTSLQKWGSQVWDGTVEDNRDDYPVSVDQYRIVKYESCRGLEGWTVVCLDFDRFLERQRREGMRRPKTLLETQEEVADRFAARWAMIPLTRAIDTLVLQVSSGSRAAQLLDSIRRGSDYVEVLGR